MGSKFAITTDVPFTGTSETDSTAPYLLVLLQEDESNFNWQDLTINVSQSYSIRIPNSVLLSNYTLTEVSINGVL